MNDVITKFTYLEHGKKAPKNSSYKGMITTTSIIGYVNYTEREEAKKLHKDAAALNAAHDFHGFFNYTTQRIGSTHTYSSKGWLDSEEKNKDFRKLIAHHFNKDGDLLWTPVISLQDHISAAEMKLYTEKDYAAVLDVVLPKFFKTAGFEPTNMEWWMDFHVNTDNPHVHLSFFEKNKTRDFGKLPMKHIDYFKKSFWNQVFAKKRYFDDKGMEAKEAFKEKDLLKKDVLQNVTTLLKNNTDKEFEKRLKRFALKLPDTGRLQYGSSHMIPFREEIDMLVDYLLHIPDVQARYEEFVKKVKSFDEVSENNIYLKNKNSFFKTEDLKLRKTIGNQILNECKCFKELAIDLSELKKAKNEEIQELHILEEAALSETFLIAVAKSLITTKYGKTWMYVPQSNGWMIEVDEHRLHDLFGSDKIFFMEIDGKESFEVYERGKKLEDLIGTDELADHFSDVKRCYGFSSIREYEELKEQGKLDRLQKYISAKEKYEEYSWKASTKRMKSISFSWMNQIENQVDIGRNEYLYGRELER